MHTVWYAQGMRRLVSVQLGLFPVCIQTMIVVIEHASAVTAGSRAMSSFGKRI